ncbi:tripartite tricarboxylate transporter substrate-binding protein [Cupriavidus sp. UME77]|uniref:tripartite tricarboxylate transporter substrate-binding protein n=1 Tax=Cupriavidus sp. UME77 TaxID=1862321 RepID=UPI0015FFAF76|nr:tripartite tricarboxylate transporter substrate-binding protein [Cupriavidus sp. UME77]MBB1633694.1 ABC transporter substrate-binding protein [Cupriavidus sp. UME77]
MKLVKIIKTGLIFSVLFNTLLAHANGEAPIKILVGFAAGGVTDIVARLFADKLRVEFNEPVIVENKPGAGSRLANQALKASPPDGKTFLISPNSGPVFLDILYPRSVLGYDLLTDLTPVAALTTYPLGMVVQRSMGVNNAREYVAWAKAHPKEAVFGSAGAGSHTHFAGMKLAQAAQINLQVVPYRGNGLINIDLLGGQLPAAIMAASDFMKHKDDPSLRIIGIFGERRSPLAPDVPTFTEQGIKATAGDAWIGMWTSAKAPQAEIDRMQRALQKILAEPEFKQKLESKLTMTPFFRSAADMKKLQRAELDMWRPVIKQSGFSPDQ